MGRIEDMCRVCLLTTQESSLLIPISRDLRAQYEELTQTVMPMSAPFPIKTCAECRDKIESAFYIVRKLVSKQIELREIINERFKLADVESQKLVNERFRPAEDQPVEEEWIEEHLEEEPEIHSLESETTISVQESDSDVEIVEFDGRLTSAELKALNVAKNLQPKKKKSTNPPATVVKNTKIVPKPAPKIVQPPGAPPNPKLIIQPVFPKGISSKHPAGLVVCTREHRCKKCGQHFPNEFALRFHLEAHPLETPIKCCKKIFRTLADFNQHRKTAHDRVFKCSRCDKSFLSPTVRNLHEKSHEGIFDLPLNIGRRFQEQAGFKRFECPFKECRKTSFPSKEVWENHIEKHINGTIFRFSCADCPETFRSGSQLRQHQKQAHYNVKCGKCTSSFRKTRDLKRHHRRCHADEKEKDKDPLELEPDEETAEKTA